MQCFIGDPVSIALAEGENLGSRRYCSSIERLENLCETSAQQQKPYFGFKRVQCFMGDPSRSPSSRVKIGVKYCSSKDLNL
jgi:hypothetical protein